jgi:hypothetical protein
MAPPREEKISSPVPIVNEAMIAPGPNIVSQAAGLCDDNAGGSGGKVILSIFLALLTKQPLKAFEKLDGSLII